MAFLKRLFSIGRDEDYVKAMDFYNRHMYREAAEVFEKILESKRSSASLHYNLAEVFCWQAQRNQAPPDETQYLACLKKISSK